MISNNFVELKGSVFKKFDKNNLFQLSCSDVRERFHLTVLLFIVIIQTMKEFDWTLSHFTVMMPDCFAVLFTEILIDWIKHAFITRFNELNETIYREYTTSLAYDTMQTRQKHAFSDHSDLVARRMGFIPFPLGVVLIKAIYSAVTLNNFASWIIFALAFAFIFGLRIALTICALGKACKLMKEHQEEKCNTSTPSSMTNVPPITNNNNNNSNFINNINHNHNLQHNISGISVYQLPQSLSSSTVIVTTNAPSNVVNTPLTATSAVGLFQQFNTNNNNNNRNTRFDVNLSPIQSIHQHHYSSQVRCSSVDSNRMSLAPNGSTALPTNDLQTTPSTISCKSDPGASGKTIKDINSSYSKATSMVLPHHNHQERVDLSVKNNLDLGATALFSNSDVDLDDICLNKHLLDGSITNNQSGSRAGDTTGFVDDSLTHSEPDFQSSNLNLSSSAMSDDGNSSAMSSARNSTNTVRRTHRRSESEPSIQNITTSGCESLDSQA